MKEAFQHTQKKLMVVSVCAIYLVTSSVISYQFESTKLSVPHDIVIEEAGPLCFSAQY